MSTSNLIDNNISLRNNIIQEILSKKTTLTELSAKFDIDESELFIWFKNLESILHETIEQPSGMFPEVDDAEWVNLSEEEKKDFINHLLKGDEYETESFTIEELEKQRAGKK